MSISHVIGAVSTIAAIVAPTIPGCGMISSMLLKVGLIITVGAAVDVIEKAVTTEEPVASDVLTTATNATVLAICITSVVKGFIPGWLGALIAMVATVTYESQFLPNGESA